MGAGSGAWDPPLFLITLNRLFPPNRLKICSRKLALLILNKVDVGLNPECHLPVGVTRNNRQVTTAWTSVYASGKWARNAYPRFTEHLLCARYPPSTLLSVACLILPATVP